MNLFGLLPKCLDKIFNGVFHFACNSRTISVPCVHCFLHTFHSPGNRPRPGFLESTH